MIDRKTFFDGWREAYGAMKQETVDGLEALLGEMEKSGWTDRRWFSYVLATVKHETAHSMAPVREYGRGAGRPYGKADPETGQVYYGRGQVQLTWRENYAKMGARLGLPLEAQPDLALEPSVSAAICCEGMQDGLFTGKSLGDYFDADTDDPFNARRIVNGTDKADVIAGYHRKILTIVYAAWREAAPPPDLDARVAALEEWRGTFTNETEAPMPIMNPTALGKMVETMATTATRYHTRPPGDVSRKVLVPGVFGAVLTSIFAAAPQIIAAYPPAAGVLQIAQVVTPILLPMLGYQLKDWAPK